MILIGWKSMDFRILINEEWETCLIMSSFFSVPILPKKNFPPFFTQYCSPKKSNSGVIGVFIDNPPKVNMKSGNFLPSPWSLLFLISQLLQFITCSQDSSKSVNHIILFGFDGLDVPTLNLGILNGNRKFMLIENYERFGKYFPLPLSTTLPNWTSLAGIH